jgi:hypothetical protein
MFGLNDLKLGGSPVEKRGQVSSFPCLIYALGVSITGFKLQSLNAQFEEILSVLPNCITYNRITFSTPQL